MNFNFLFILLITILISWLIVTWVIQRAEHLQLVQIPNHRSSHEKPTPGGGGIGIVITGTLAATYFLFTQPWQLFIGFILALPLAIIGLIDDIYPAPARLRFGLQLILNTLLVTAFTYQPILSGSNDLSFLGILFNVALIFFGIWWINLFNFMDGIDGIAGTQAISMLLTGVMLSMLTTSASHSNLILQLMLTTSAATLGFLILNWPPARIFMGDVGSTWLAFIIFTLALMTIHAGWMSYISWLILAAAFVSDATVTLFTRVMHGERWYEAHRSHAYQHLSRRWQGNRKAGHRLVTLLTLAVNILWLAPLAWASLYFPNWPLLWLLLAYAPLVIGCIYLGAGRPDHA
ncbi:glycosyltransferase family 4 protein [Chitinivorax sp. B]|uniref:MraY family glycosyltransferase n=1 Tax=Chitinivorax sp. B TaxID=2502235 RepID=UPI0010F632ED|nr:glycosyltransferase family 4 protein [Chitinivorax sp. B]